MAIDYLACAIDYPATALRDTFSEGRTHEQNLQRATKSAADRKHACLQHADYLIAMEGAVVLYVHPQLDLDDAARRALANTRTEVLRFRGMAREWEWAEEELTNLLHAAHVRRTHVVCARQYEG